MIAAAVAWFASSKVGRWLAIAGAVIMGALVVRWKWMSEGRAGERQAQTERNRKAREDAARAQRDALTAPDPRQRLRDKYSRPDAE